MKIQSKKKSKKVISNAPSNVLYLSFPKEKDDYETYISSLSAYELNIEVHHLVLKLRTAMGLIHEDSQKTIQLMKEIEGRSSDLWSEEIFKIRKDLMEKMK
jgi:hypothetical protein